MLQGGRVSILSGMKAAGPRERAHRCHCSSCPHLIRRRHTRASYGGSSRPQDGIDQAARGTCLQLKGSGLGTQDHARTLSRMIASIASGRYVKYEQSNHHVKYEQSNRIDRGRRDCRTNSRLLAENGRVWSNPFRMRAYTAYRRLRHRFLGSWIRYRRAYGIAPRHPLHRLSRA